MSRHLDPDTDTDTAIAQSVGWYLADEGLTHGRKVCTLMEALVQAILEMGDPDAVLTEVVSLLEEHVDATPQSCYHEGSQ